jgi:hypothetical protein
MLHLTLPMYCTTLFAIGWVQSCVSVRSVPGLPLHVRMHSIASWWESGVARVLLVVASVVAASTSCHRYDAGPVHDVTAVFHRCSVRADSDSNTVVQVFRVPRRCARRCCLQSRAGVQGRAAVVCYHSADERVWCVV